jgi:hypothetical protein
MMLIGLAFLMSHLSPKLEIFLYLYCLVELWSSQGHSYWEEKGKTSNNYNI